MVAGPTGSTLLFGVLSSSGALWPITAGSSLGAPSNTGYGTITGQTADVLPDGDAIIAATDNGGNTTFSYREANGTVGGSVVVKNVSSFAANADELLTISAGNGASAASYTIGSGGNFTANGAPIKIFSDGTLFGETWAALDPDGTAEVLISAINENQASATYGDGYMAEVQRLATGAWQTPVQVPGSESADTNNLHAAVAPTGRMIATWSDDVEVNGYFYTKGVYAQTREPGGTFGSPIQLLDQSSVPVGGVAAESHPTVAAGPDGTLAATVTGLTCPDQQVSTEETSSTTVWVAPPGGQFTSYAVPGSTVTRTTDPTVSALGTGGDKAVVALHTATITNAANTEDGDPFFYGSCGSEEGYPSAQSFSDSAVVLGPNTDSVSPTFGTGGQTGTGTVTDVTVTSAAIDPNGNSTVSGSLTAPNTLQYATFGNVGSPVSTRTNTTPGSTPTNSGPSTPPAGTPAPGGSTSPGTPAKLAGTINPPPAQTSAKSTTVVPTIVGQNGDQLITTTNNSDAVENISIGELALQSGLIKSMMARPDAASDTAKAKLITIASGHIRLKPHTSGRLTLHLTKAARAQLAGRGGRLPVTLNITTTAAGHKPTVITRHLVLKLGNAKGTKAKGR